MQGVLQQVAGGFKHSVLQGLMGNAPLWKHLAEDREVAQCLRFCNFFLLFLFLGPQPLQTPKHFTHARVYSRPQKCVSLSLGCVDLPGTRSCWCLASLQALHTKTLHPATC